MQQNNDFPPLSYIPPASSLDLFPQPAAAHIIFVRYDTLLQSLWVCVWRDCIIVGAKWLGLCACVCACMRAAWFNLWSSLLPSISPSHCPIAPSCLHSAIKYIVFLLICHLFVHSGVIVHLSHLSVCPLTHLFPHPSISWTNIYLTLHYSNLLLPWLFSVSCILRCKTQC